MTGASAKKERSLRACFGQVEVLTLSEAAEDAVMERGGFRGYGRGGVSCGQVAKADTCLFVPSASSFFWWHRMVGSAYDAT